MTYSFELASIADNTRQVKPVKLPPEAFSVLTQVRKTLSVTEDLMPSILARGQQTPGAAAALVESEARIYLTEVNRIFDTQHGFSSLQPVVLDGITFYLPLIAGHRRHTTCVLLNREIKEGKAEYTRNFDGQYRVDLHFGISALDAIEYQFNENRHAQVPPHEEAEAAWRFWRYRTELEEGLTCARFARSIGRTPEWVRSALRFCNLPTDVQSYVTGDNKINLKLPYRILVDLARLAEGYESITGESLPNEAYHLWIRKAVLGRLNSVQFGKNVSAYLEEKRAEQQGQGSLFSLDMTDDVQAERHIRRVVGENLVRGLWLFASYFNTVERTRQAGLLGGEDYLFFQGGEIPFSPGSPVRMMSEVIDLAAELVPHLAELARKERRGGYRKLSEADPLLQQVRVGIKSLLALEQRQKAN